MLQSIVAMYNEEVAHLITTRTKKKRKRLTSYFLLQGHDPSDPKLTRYHLLKILPLPNTTNWGQASNTQGLWGHFRPKQKEWVDTNSRKCHGVLRKGPGPILSQHMLCVWADHSPWRERLYLNDSGHDDKPPGGNGRCVPVTTPRALVGHSILRVLLFPIHCWCSKSFLLKKRVVQESQDDLMKGHAGIREERFCTYPSLLPIKI